MKVDLRELHAAHYEPWTHGRELPLEVTRIDVAIRPIGRGETRQILTFDLWIESHCTFQIGKRGCRYFPALLKEIGGRLDPILEQRMRHLYASSWDSIRP